MECRFESCAGYHQHVAVVQRTESNATNVQTGVRFPPAAPHKRNIMAKADKKKAKLVERLAELEASLRLSLQKKSSSAAEIDVPGKTRQIQELRAQIAAM